MYNEQKIYCNGAKSALRQDVPNPPKVPQILPSIDWVDTSISNLEVSLGQLLQRLSPICDGSQNDSGNAGLATPQDPCELAARIKQQSNRIESITLIVNRVTNALEI